MSILFPLIFRIFPKQNYKAMAVWPFVFVKTNELKTDLVIMNHEKIHLRQQLECLVIPFYIIYFTEYLWGRMKLKDHNLAYRNISYEKEAYKNDSDLNYLPKRKAWANFRKA